MNFPKDLKYTKEHEWVKVNGKEAAVGVTDHAQHELGDVVFVEVPEEGGEFSRGEGFAVIESVKAVSDVYAPVSGKVIRINEALADSPELINTDPYGQAWIAVFELSNLKELDDLMTADEYKKFLEEGEGE
ncbi:MAG: glycine cleavage system protein GcvH [Firmicutes bacterium]|nr:glycine cleavage system protein GcvH [Bacillota bacterium]